MRFKDCTGLPRGTRVQLFMSIKQFIRCREHNVRWGSKDRGKVAPGFLWVPHPEDRVPPAMISCSARESSQLRGPSENILNALSIIAFFLHLALNLKRIDFYVFITLRHLYFVLFLYTFAFWFQSFNSDIWPTLCIMSSIILELTYIIIDSLICTNSDLYYMLDGCLEFH